MDGASIWAGYDFDQPGSALRAAFLGAAAGEMGRE